MPLGVGGSGKGTASATSCTTNTFNTTSGSVLVVGGVSDWDKPITSFTDNKGNGNATLLATTLSHNNASSRMGFWQNIIGGSGHTVTANVGSSSDLLVFAVEVTGAATSNADDGVTRQASNADPYTSGTIATTVANVILIGLIGTDEFSAVTFTANNSFTKILEELAGTNFTGCIAYRIVSATGSYESSFSMTGASGNSKGIWVAAFEEGTAGPGSGSDLGAVQFSESSANLIRITVPEETA